MKLYRSGSLSQVAVLALAAGFGLLSSIQVWEADGSQGFLQGIIYCMYFGADPGSDLEYALVYMVALLPTLVFSCAAAGCVSFEMDIAGVYLLPRAKSAGRWLLGKLAALLLQTLELVFVYVFVIAAAQYIATGARPSGAKECAALMCTALFYALALFAVSVVLNVLSLRFQAKWVLLGFLSVMSAFILLLVPMLKNRALAPLNPLRHFFIHWHDKLPRVYAGFVEPLPAAPKGLSVWHSAAYFSAVVLLGVLGGFLFLRKKDIFLKRKDQES
jgi:ABC-type transport system involved in multi-copper enzyme maturation permease subunit